MANDSYILVDAKGAPVPLPFHTSYTRDDNGEQQACTIHRISRDPNPSSDLRNMRRGAVEVHVEGRPYFGWDPAHLDLRLITESEFMAAQQEDGQ